MRKNTEFVIIIYIALVIFLPFNMDLDKNNKDEVFFGQEINFSQTVPKHVGTHELCGNCLIQNSSSVYLADVDVLEKAEKI